MRTVSQDDAAYGHLNSVCRRHVATLQKRAAHLSARIAGAPGRRLTYDESEREALQWALSVIARTEDFDSMEAR